MGHISLDTQPDDAQISLDTGGTGVPVSPDVIDKRSDKAFVGSGQAIGASKSEIKDAMISGNEPQIRQQAAAAVNQENMGRKQSLLMAAAQSATPDQMAALSQWGITPEDPNTVLEKNYGKWFTNTQSPLFNFREYVNTQAENSDAAAHQQGWVPWLAQQGLNAIPGWYELNMRWTAQDFPSMWKGLLGDEMSSIADDIYSDPTTAKDKFDKAYKSLEYNPALQSAFAHSVLGMSNDEKLLNNVFTLFDLSTFAGAAKFGNGVAKSLAESNANQRAVRRLYEAAGKADAGPWGNPTIAKLNGEGKVEEAAVTKAAEDLVDKFNGKSNTVKETIEDLPSAWRIDESTLEAGGGGNYGSGIINLIKENFDNYKNNVMNVLQNTMRVNRTPVVEAAPDVVTKYKENLKGKYKGPNNTLMEVEGPFHQNEPNSYMYTYIMGDENRVPFETAQQAANASRQYGYPSAEGLHERINREVGPKLTDLEMKIRQVRDDMRVPPEMDADVHELNRYDSLGDKLRDLEKQRDDLMAYHAEHLVGPEVKIPGSTIREIGKNRYVIAYNIPQKDTDQILRDGSIYGYAGPVKGGKREGTVVPGMDQHIRSTLAWIRTGGETLSPSEVSQRVIATHGAGAFLKIAQANSEIIAKIPRRLRGDFQKVLEANQEMLDPHDGLKGYYFETVPQLEEHYLTHIGRMPEQSEILGYWANKQNWDYDRILRGLLSMNNKNSAGVESHSIELRDNSTGRTLHSPHFDGIGQKYAPGGQDLVAVLGDDSKSTIVMHADSDRYKRWLRKYGQKDIDGGKKQVVEIYDVDSRPLASFLGDNRAIRHVITNKFNRRSLELDEQIGRRGGGHWDFDYDFAVKQANMVPEKTGSRFRDRYEGDNFVAWVQNEAQGREFVKHLNEVNNYIAKDMWDEAETYFKNHFSFNWKDHKANYFPKKVEGKIQHPIYNAKEPFYVVRKDQKIGDLGQELANRYPNTFYDATRQGSVYRTQQIQYTGERDARDVMAVERQGNWRNPIFNYMPAKLVDPFTTMDRALSRIINSNFMEDYKRMGAEHWLQNAKDHLDVEPSMVRDAPWHVFNTFNPDKSFKKGVDESVKRVLTNNWKKINDFVGMPSATDRWIHRASEKFSTMLYNKTGMILPSSMLPRITNPLQFARSAVFDMKFLYSPGTFFTQFSTFVNVALINLRHAPATTAGMVLHQLARMNARPEILDHFGKIAENFGFRPGEWEEARQALLTWSNFAKVGAEHANLDSVVQNRTISNTWHNVQYFGRKFFEEGAESTRIAAFYSAYRQFRHENPTKAIGRLQKEEILSRAADLDHNMSRAFNSSAHTGGASLFGQFYAYAMRLFELMTGKRLTMVEKLQLGVGSSLMWGIPMGGLGLYGFPLGDLIRKEMVANYGYLPGNNTFQSVMMEGIPAVMHSFITGQWYDYSKFGTKGVDPVLDLVEGSRSLWEVFGGATVQSFSDAWRRTSPIIFAMDKILKGEIKLSFQDYISPFREYTAINDEERLRIALQTGRWTSKNGTYLTDVDRASAWFMTLTGLQQTDVTDLSILRAAGQKQRDWDSWTINNYTREMNRANAALMQDPPDREAHDRHMKNAQVWFDQVPIDRQSSALSASRSAMTPLVDRSRWNFYTKDVPPGQEGPRSDTLQQWLKGKQ